MFQMRGKGEMSCLKLFISIQHLSAFLLSQEERHFFPTNVILFMGDVLDVSFFFVDIFVVVAFYAFPVSLSRNGP